METLTVVIFSYNHERFLPRALDSVLNQVTDFDYKILVADDASTDKSPQIIREYAQRHPSRIVALLRSENLGSMENFRQTLAEVRSRYVLVNDGDDWLTDVHKLQRQVEYLEQHPECSLCFHPVQIVRESAPSEYEVFPPESDCRPQGLKELLKRNFLQTNAVMYRWGFNDGQLLKHLPGDILPGDYFLHLLHAEKGSIGFLPQMMSAYFRHAESVWAGDAKTPQWFLRCADPHIRFYHALEARYGVDMKNGIRFMQKHLQMAQAGELNLVSYLWLFVKSKITFGEIRKLNKSLLRMAKSLSK